MTCTGSFCEGGGGRVEARPAQAWELQPGQLVWGGCAYLFYTYRSVNQRMSGNPAS